MNKVVNIQEKFNLFKEYWTPKILGEINDSYVKIFKAKGEFVWHSHEHEDEFFLVIKGQLTIKFRGSEVTIKAGEFFIVPKGIEHCPYAEEEVHVLLLEPKGVVNTGKTESDKTAKNLEWL
jgi:mannose-6-phosphate isomerase-like protein (cupin superfamily)